jgi:hypothetical protein
LIVSNVAWVRDRKRRPVLQLSIDGHRANIRSDQKRELTRRGILKGVDFLASEWRDQADHAFIKGDVEPGLAEADLVGCTDDPRVFALYGEMCRAIAADTWQPGPRPPLVDGRGETAPLRRRQARVMGQPVIAKIAAKESHIAQLEAELAEPRGDYEQANWDCVRSTADHAHAKARLEQSRDRLRRASSRLSGLQRDLREHGRKLTELHAEAQGRNSQQAPPAGSREGFNGLACHSVPNQPRPRPFSMSSLAHRGGVAPRGTGLGDVS